MPRAGGHGELLPGTEGWHPQDSQEGHWGHSGTPGQFCSPVVTALLPFLCYPFCEQHLTPCPCSEAWSKAPKPRQQLCPSPLHPELGTDLQLHTLPWRKGPQTHGSQDNEQGTGDPGWAGGCRESSQQAAAVSEWEESGNQGTPGWCNQTQGTATAWGSSRTQSSQKPRASRGDRGREGGSLASVSSDPPPQLSPPSAQLLCPVWELLKHPLCAQSSSASTQQRHCPRQGQRCPQPREPQSLWVTASCSSASAEWGLPGRGQSPAPERGERALPRPCHTQHREIPKPGTVTLPVQVSDCLLARDSSSCATVGTLWAQTQNVPGAE